MTRHPIRTRIPDAPLSKPLSGGAFHFHPFNRKDHTMPHAPFQAANGLPQGPQGRHTTPSQACDVAKANDRIARWVCVAHKPGLRPPSWQGTRCASRCIPPQVARPALMPGLRRLPPTSRSYREV